MESVYAVKDGNVFEACLGRSALKWDAFWHLFEWLLTPEEGHGLGPSIQLRLIEFAFGTSEATCVVKREFPVSGQMDGKGKWVDLALGIPTLVSPTHLIIMDDVGVAHAGDMRKLKNLTEYMSLSKQSHPNAQLRTVVVTNAPNGAKLASAVYKALGEEALEYAALTGWRLLSLHTIGSWVKESAINRQESLSIKTKYILEDFVEWCQ
jgi:hypothetical protein